MKLLSVVGARPQFIKAAVICQAIAREQSDIVHRIVHTGQHYDTGMSEVFFRELGIPAPDYNLSVGSGTHGVQTGEMLKRLDPILLSEQPDWVLVFGDTNSTLAGVLAACKLHFPTAHVEAGMRSYDRGAPEEINRIVTDQLADLLLCATPYALENLRKEGLHDRAVITGDVMYDAFIGLRDLAENQGKSSGRSLPLGAFALATVHRADNTDNPARLSAIMSALDKVARDVCPIVLPLHPRTRSALAAIGCAPSSITIIEPASYLEMIDLLSRACFVLTDSGGVQKEAYFAKTPCITMRSETEWGETLENGCNVLTGADEDRIVAAARQARYAGPWTAVYGEGNAGTLILEALRRGRQTQMLVPPAWSDGVLAPSDPA